MCASQWPTRGRVTVGGQIGDAVQAYLAHGSSCPRYLSLAPAPADEMPRCRAEHISHAAPQPQATLGRPGSADAESQPRMLRMGAVEG